MTQNAERELVNFLVRRVFDPVLRAEPDGTPPIANWMRRDKSVAAEIVRQTPRGKIGSANEIANAVLWLCSDAASFMIGSPMIIDGGYMA